jgi:mannose/fructose/N-acetylgalactosamine-specific phosphotransferase system component IID
MGLLWLRSLIKKWIKVLHFRFPGFFDVSETRVRKYSLVLDDVLPGIGPEIVLLFVYGMDLIPSLRARSRYPI